MKEYADKNQEPVNKDQGMPDPQREIHGAGWGRGESDEEKEAKEYNEAIYKHPETIERLRMSEALARKERKEMGYRNRKMKSDIPIYYEKNKPEEVSEVEEDTEEDTAVESPLAPGGGREEDREEENVEEDNEVAAKLVSRQEDDKVLRQVGSEGIGIPNSAWNWGIKQELTPYYKLAERIKKGPWTVQIGLSADIGLITGGTVTLGLIIGNSPQKGVQTGIYAEVASGVIAGANVSLSLEVVFSGNNDIKKIRGEFWKIGVSVGNGLVGGFEKTFPDSKDTKPSYSVNFGIGYEGTIIEAHALRGKTFVLPLIYKDNKFKAK